MPRKIIKYGCSFKCGTRAMHSVKEAVSHENKCVKNPENKTCETCINRIYGKEYDEYRVWHYRDCKMPVMSAFIDEVHGLLEIQSGVHHVKPLVGCPNYNL